MAQHVAEKFKNRYRIASTRKTNWNYAWPGYYFVTICTRNRDHLFGRIENGVMQLSECGDIAQKFWLEIPKHFSYVTLDEFVVMPDHVHGILAIDGMKAGAVLEADAADVGRAFQRPGKGSVSTVVCAYKAACTKAMHNMLSLHGPLWQDRFYDRVITTDEALNRIREYIRDNPKNWNVSALDEDEIMREMRDG